MTTNQDFEEAMAQLRPLLVLLARVHLDARYQDREASNIAQEVLIDAVKYKERLHNLHTEQLHAWARKVVRHKVIDFYRAKQPMLDEAELARIQADVNDSFLRIEEFATASDTSPSEAFERAEQWLRIAKAIDRLPDEYRDVVIRKDLAGWKIREIAREKCCSVGAIAGLLRRGRERLGEELAEDES